MTQTAECTLLQTIKELLRDEGWREIALEARDEGFEVEAQHVSDPVGVRVAFGLGPADLDAIVRVMRV